MNDELEPSLSLREVNSRGHNHFRQPRVRVRGNLHANNAPTPKMKVGIKKVHMTAFTLA